MRKVVGLDISLQETAVCVLDRDGQSVWQGKVDSEPGPLIEQLKTWQDEIDLVDDPPRNRQCYQCVVLCSVEAVCRMVSNSEGLAVKIELMAGTTNVVRFPVERRARPTMGLLREALNIAESFGLSMPEHDARHTADAPMADHIANYVRPEPGLERKASLEALLKSVIGRAVAACRTAHDAALAATEGQQRLVEAHFRSEGAEGANRAVRMAMQNETWMPFVLQDEAEVLFFGSRNIG
jgi:hypothetical protein